MTSERERETLDLLLTTTITPWQILWGKLIAGLRVSSVLTMFLLWPVLLASLMVQSYWNNLLAVAAYLLVVLLTCLSTAMLALFNSVIFRKTAHSMMSTYIALIVLFCMPPAALSFFETLNLNGAELVATLGVTSPFSASFEIPLYMDAVDDATISSGSHWFFFLGHASFSITLNLLLLAAMIWLFNTRWRVAS